MAAAKPKRDSEKPGSVTETRSRSSSPPKPARSVDRHHLCLWLVDQARDLDETAAHVETQWRKANPPPSSEDAAGDVERATAYSRAFVNTAMEIQRHVDRARTFRDVAAALRRGDPDLWWPPDLHERVRKSDAAAAITASGEHVINRVEFAPRERPLSENIEPRRPTHDPK